MYKNTLKWLNDWGLLIITISVVLVYTVIASDFTTIQTLNKSVGTNVLFAIINLLSAFYIARKVSLWGWLSDTTSNQKKIAKTAIRHNRGNLASILRLIRITNDKIVKVEDPLTKQYISEIQNHLGMIYTGIKNSEADFNEIVNEELKEENSLEIAILEIYSEIEQKNKTISELSTSSDEKQEEINKLKKQLRESETELMKKISSLPFGTASIESGTTFGYYDKGYPKIVGKIDLDFLKKQETTKPNKSSEK